ncbi:amino acid/polyamine antiporter [Fragilaria crotonensis]|nr:amino acid/polyamine antiporter [Fragilaria crotonensis]
MDLSSYSISAITRRRPLTPSNSYINNTVAVASATVSGSGVRDNLSLQQNQPQQQERENTPQHNNKLHRHLTLTDIIFYGVGCSVGAGIYSLVGLVAYTFTYVSFGELCAWLVGWNLTLGYAVSAAVVARSWADYVMGFVQGFLVDSDDNTNYNNNSSTQWLTKLRIPMVFGDDYTCCPLSMVIIGFCTLVLVTGVKESSRFQTAMTVLNLSVLGFVLLAGLGTGTVRAENLFPIFPHGIAGMARGAGLVFFAYLGFDMVACLSEEVKNPERNMPIGIIGSLVVSMSIYVSVALVVVGMAPAILLGQDIPVTNALLANACCSPSQQLQQDAVTTCLSYATCDPILLPILFVGSRIISFGAIFGLTTATFSCLMGQPRIFYSMAQDGLLFKIYARVHPRTGVPTIGTILTGIFTALVACFFDLESLANAISLGTLQVFTFVNAGVILLRMRPLTTISDNTTASSPYAKETTPLLGEPKSPIVRDPRAAAVVRSLGLIKKSSRDIRTSLGLRVPVIPLLGILCNSYMMGSMPSTTWLVISAWLMAGLLFYGIYGIHHSELRECVDGRTPAAAATTAATSTTASLLEAANGVVPSVHPLLPPFADFGEKL